MLTDVPMRAGDDDDLVVLRQEYSLRFQSADAFDHSRANLVNRSKSGNPGYIFGRPVLAGHIFTSDQESDVISARIPHETC